MTECGNEKIKSPEGFYFFFSAWEKSKNFIFCTPEMTEECGNEKIKSPEGFYFFFFAYRIQVYGGKEL